MTTIGFAICWSYAVTTSVLRFDPFLPSVTHPGPSENLASRLLDRTSARCQRKTLLSAEYLLPVLSLSIYCMMSPDPSERTDCADVL